MKTLFTLLAGSFLPSMAHTIAMHPGVFDMALGILFGLIAGLLIAVVSSTSSLTAPPKRHAPVVATGSKPTQRRSVRRMQPAYTFTPTNYEWSAA